MARISLDDLVNWINEDESELIEMAGGLNVVLGILEKKGALNRIDFNSETIDDDLNTILFKLITQFGPDVAKQTYERIKTEILNDNKLIYKDGKWYMVLDEIEELSLFFCKLNRQDSRSLAERILNQDDYFEFFYNTVDDLYDDVISELDDNNTIELRNHIYRSIIGTTVTLGSELLEDLCGGNCDDKVTITDENFDDVFQDEKTLVFLLENYLNDIRSQLYNNHWNAYNNAYSDEIYESLWDQLSQYVSKSSSDWVGFESKKDPSKKYYMYYADVTNSIDKLILDFLDSNKGYGGSHRIAYYGGLYSLIDGMINNGEIDCLYINTPDYPDHRKVREYLNNNFDLSI